MTKIKRTSSKNKPIKRINRNKEPKLSNKQSYVYEEYGDLENFSSRGEYIISVIYDLPGVATRNQECGRVFDQTHWLDRINLFKYAVNKILNMNINAIAICLPADFIGSLYTHDGLIPESLVPNEKIIKTITKCSPYKKLIKAWNNVSRSLIFGFGYNGSNEESDQLICAITNGDGPHIARKWADLGERQSPKDWSRQIMIGNKKLTLAVCYDLEKYYWGKKYKGSILVDCRHISVIGQKKKWESEAEARRRTGGVAAGRTPMKLNEKVKLSEFTRIFVPVFRFREKIRQDWNPADNFAWAAKKGLKKPSNYSPLAGFIVENKEKSERAFFNIFKL